MILPPDMTSKMLTAQSNGGFDALMRSLGIVTAAANSYAGFGGGMSNTSIGSQHNGNVYYIDGVEMRNITENTTLGELARCAKNLSLKKGS